MAAAKPVTPSATEQRFVQIESVASASQSHADDAINAANAAYANSEQTKRYLMFGGIGLAALLAIVYFAKK